MRYCIGLMLTLSLFACQNESGPVEEETGINLEELLPGTWEIIDIKVVVNTVNGEDSIYIAHISENQWGQQFGIKPQKLSYLPDNKYRRERRTLNGDVLETNRGIWNTFSDTLMMIEPDATYQYVVMTNNKGLTEYRSLIDWDGDGDEDDEYVGTQRLVSRSVEGN